MSDKEDKHGKAIGEFVEATFAGFMFGGDKDQIPMELVRKTMKDGLKAKDVRAAKVTEVIWTPKGREIKNEYFVYSKPLIDHSTRARYLDMAIKIAGGYPAQKVEHGGEVLHKHKDELTPAVQEVFEKIISRDEK